MHPILKLFLVIVPGGGAVLTGMAIRDLVVARREAARQKRAIEDARRDEMVRTNALVGNHSVEKVKDAIGQIIDHGTDEKGGDECGRPN